MISQGYVTKLAVVGMGVKPGMQMISGELIPLPIPARGPYEMTQQRFDRWKRGRIGLLTGDLGEGRRRSNYRF